MTDVIAVDASPGPKTHALVIGVGRFRHLRGGTPRSPAFGTWASGNYPRLSFSARAVVAWLAERVRAPRGAPRQRPGAPFARPTRSSRQMRPDARRPAAIAPPALVATQAGPVPVDPATIANVRPAFADLGRSLRPGQGQRRASSTSRATGSRRIPWLSSWRTFGELVGHAVPGGDRLQQDPPRDAHDVPASLACFWVDSCRSVPIETLEKLTLERADPARLQRASGRTRSPARRSSMRRLITTVPTAGATKPTQFTKALLTSLRPPRHREAAWSLGSDADEALSRGSNGRWPASASSSCLKPGQRPSSRPRSRNPAGYLIRRSEDRAGGHRPRWSRSDSPGRPGRAGLPARSSSARRRRPFVRERSRARSAGTGRSRPASTSSRRRSTRRGSWRRHVDPSSGPCRPASTRLSRLAAMSKVRLQAPSAEDLGLQPRRARSSPRSSTTTWTS